MGNTSFQKKVVAYMKKELHRHHEDAGTALEILYGIVGAKTVVSCSPIYLLGLDIEREKTTVFDGTEFTFWRAKTKGIWTEIGLYGGRQDLSLSGRELYPLRAELTERTELVEIFNQVHVIDSAIVLCHIKRRVA